jgi:hypothetical protein
METRINISEYPEELTPTYKDCTNCIEAKLEDEIGSIQVVELHKEVSSRRSCLMP